MWFWWVGWGSGAGSVAGSSFPAVLICHSNEQAVMHGHLAIMFGYHANAEHHRDDIIQRNMPSSMKIAAKYQLFTRLQSFQHVLDFIIFSPGMCLYGWNIDVFIHLFYSHH